MKSLINTSLFPVALFRISLFLNPLFLIPLFLIPLFLITMLSGCSSLQSEATLYEDIGGTKVLSRVFGLAVKRIYADPEIGHYFKGIPKNHIRKHLTTQTCELIGGPCKYEGRSMIDAHEDFGFTDREFFILVEHVQSAMRDIGLTYQQENLILQHLAKLKSQVVYL